jgi:FixJ family two-component response regulator
MDGIASSTVADTDIVAIVDDDDAARDALQFLLTVLGRRQRAFASSAAFLEERATNFGCLLLDQHMPGMTGLELAQHLRSHSITIPIMLITGGLTADIQSCASEIGIDEICEKPPEPGMIAAFVERSLDARAS